MDRVGVVPYNPPIMSRECRTFFVFTQDSLFLGFSVLADTSIINDEIMIVRTKFRLLLILSSIPWARSAVVVTIGDSYAAGTGVHASRKDYDDTYCYVEKDTIPGGKYAFTRGLDHIVSACAGDDVAETVAQWDDLQLRYSNEATDLWEGSVIIISTGGNSVRTGRGENFEGSLVRCLTTGRCHKEEDNQVVNYDDVQAELEAFYSQLAAEAGGATVRVMGYPKIFNSNRLKCFIPGISVREADFFDSFALKLNERIIVAVDAAKATFPDFDIRYVDVASYYTNGACFPFKFRQVRDINVRSPVSSFHPTQYGYDRAYGALLDTIRI